jgi:predicted lysophospholipase L1 biosynthesis ABC-type transport system permease subunit
VNQSLARHLWGTGNATGRTLELDGGLGGPPTRIFVAGVAKDVIHGEVKQGPRPWLYLPLGQQHEVNAHLHVAAADSAMMRRAIQQAVHGLDPELPAISVRDLDEVLREVFFEQRLVAWNSGVFGAIALLLAALGVYAVVAYSVAQRTREYGIRIALGATGHHISRLVLRQILAILAFAVPAGMAGYAAGGQIVRSYLVGVSPVDAAAAAAALLLIMAATLLAAYLPARRATRVDPAETLRYE